VALGFEVAGTDEVDAKLGSAEVEVPEAGAAGAIGMIEPGVDAPGGGVGGGGGGYLAFSSSSLSPASLPRELFCSFCITS